MCCQRCRGLLVCETFGGLREDTGDMDPATRCINCGCSEDAVIRTNRLSPPAAKQSIHHRAEGVVFIHTHSEEYRSH